MNDSVIMMLLVSGLFLLWIFLKTWKLLLVGLVVLAVYLAPYVLPYLGRN